MPLVAQTDVDGKIAANANIVLYKQGPEPLAVDADSSSERLMRRIDPQVPDLAMPGVDIISASVGGGYPADSGTSMAAPHASGLAALLWEAFPNAGVDQVERTIYESCTRTETLPEDRAGRGFSDAVKALAALRGTAKTSVTAVK